MKNLWNQVDEHLLKKAPLTADRLPTFYPSAASTIDEVSGEVIGACLREQYYRCMGYERSDKPTAYSQYIFAAGKIWEQWIIEQFKMMGQYLGSNIKFVDTNRYISGEVDLVVKDPENEAKKLILEIKTWYGYEATKQICGTAYEHPTPKDSNVLQAFIYLDQFMGQVDKSVLMYLSRENQSRNQFEIEMVEIDGKHYPKISTFWDKATNAEKIFSYVDKRISIEGIYARYAELMEALKSGIMPKGDFRHSYTKEEIEQRFKDGLISKTAYEKWQKDKNALALGYWKCKSYCDYRTTCKAQKDEDGDL